MHSDTEKPHDSNTPDQVPLSDLNDIEPNQAIAVRSVKDDLQTILAGTTTGVPARDVETIIKRQDNPYNASTVTKAVINIDADIHWHIYDDCITDHSSRLENRPPIKRYDGDEPTDPPSCSLAATTHHEVELIIPTPNGSGPYVKDYYPAKKGSVVEIKTGPIVNPEEGVTESLTHLD